MKKINKLFSFLFFIMIVVQIRKRSLEYMRAKYWKLIFVRKKNDWNKKSSGDYRYVESKINPQNNCKDNSQLYLESHIFPKNSKQNENNPNLNIEIINTRIEEEKAKSNRNDRYHLGEENQKRDLSNNVHNLWGSMKRCSNWANVWAWIFPWCQQQFRS